ncbi:MAG: DUF5320 domain-containing protein [Candidatus Falkowbacteria bacterium]
MPLKDGTGPQGTGPATGRGMGPCGAARGVAGGVGQGRRIRGGQARGLGFRAKQAGRSAPADK